MTGKFIISLDCEGKWGVADRLQPHHQALLTNANLLSAYKDLLTLLDRYNIAGTFAFVIAMLTTEQERRSNPQLFDQIRFSGGSWRGVSNNGGNWLDFQKNDGEDGWFCPELLDLVRAHPEHEIACHSFSHVPMDEAVISADVMSQELESAKLIAKIKGIELKTFVYPRNIIGYTDILDQFGYVGYRDDIGNSVSKIVNTVRELNVFEKAQVSSVGNFGSSLNIIPSGHIINLRKGFRKNIPLWATKQRWKSIVNDAVKNGRVAHLWLHPHNLIDSPLTLNLTEEILSYVDSERSKGKIEVCTQLQYACDFSNQTKSGPIPSREPLRRVV